MRHQLLKLFACTFLFVLSSRYSFGQEDLPTDYLSKEFHKGRREAARGLMPDSSVMIVFAAPTRKFSNDLDYFYHQAPDMYYFTGYKEPHAVLFLFKEEQKAPDGSAYHELFFIQKKDALSEQWTGRRLGVKGVQEKLGIMNVLPGGELNNYRLDLASFKKILTDPFPIDVPDNPNDAADLYDLMKQVKSKAVITDPKDPRIDSRNYRLVTAKLRGIKTPEEMYLVRKSVEISCMAHNEAMKSLRPDMSELEIQGLQEFVHKKYGAEGVGYGSIIGAGENGCILHYMENTKTKIGNNLLLMDVGAEYHGYSADVTRTIPAKGRFSPEERQIYQLVYDAQEAAFKILKEGAVFANASAAAKEVIANGLLKLGIIKDKKDVGKYYPHGLGHHIGLDVHDRGMSDTLRKNMVWTVEPGIYIPMDSPVDKKWKGIGIRIEDDVLITENGYELLSAFSPRSIEDIEKMMQQKSVMKTYKLPELQTVKKKQL